MFKPNFLHQLENASFRSSSDQIETNLCNQKYADISIRWLFQYYTILHVYGIYVNE